MNDGMGPLAGITVVDLTRALAGPYGTMMLADAGAEVIKVEMPKGDPGRAYVPVQFETENRNKRSIALDLKNPAAKEVVQRLARSAHIVLEGFRPGVAKRLGIDYDSLRKANARLVY
jgi:crotonobetainyl-CoA:carnitine CoA-transferase CaiB-like acyl-CoA transferase